MAVVDRRIGLLFGGFLLLLLIAAGRTAYLGVFQSGALSAAADSQQLTVTPIPAQRGEITDRNGQVLAISEAADEVIADPFLIAQPQKQAAALAPLLDRVGLLATERDHTQALPRVQQSVLPYQLDDALDLGLGDAITPR